MVKNLLLIAFLAFFSLKANAQSITVSGLCMEGNIRLSSNGTLNGKPLYQGTGTVAGFPNVTVSMYWIGAPDNVWVLDFDGQPYFFNTCNSAIPFGTGNPGCPWNPVDGTTCGGSNPLFVGGTVLAATISSFSAQKINSEVGLTWKTLTEIENKGFSIQRSIDGNNWSSIGYVKGAGNSSIELKYAFVDKAPFNGQNYYRLEREDYNGNKRLSEVVSVDMAGSSFYTILQNPIADNIQVMIHTDEQVSGAVYDASGRKMLTQTLKNGMQKIEASSFASGVYFLQLNHKGQSVMVKLIKL